MRGTLFTTLLVTLSLASFACAPDSAIPDGNSAEGASQPEPSLEKILAFDAEIDHSLQTWHDGWIQVDWSSSADPGDANLFTGDDPADGSPSADLPVGGAAYIDWDDLGDELANHRYLDLSPTKGKETSAFPRANSCVGEAKILSKMDLTYVGAANNNEKAWFVVQRASNNGDAAYYWLVSRVAPDLDPASAACHPGEALLSYDLRGPDPLTGAAGDVLMVGHFHESSGPQLRVFEAVADVDDLPAAQALAYTDPSLWSEVSDGFVVAVNTTPTRAGSWGDQGVVASDGVDLEEGVLAELALDLSLIKGDNICDGSFYGTVITRSSGAGELSPDFKDLAGPIALDMMSVHGQASLEAGCDRTVHYQAWADEGSEAQCDWLFDDGTEIADSCEGEVELAAGSRSAVVTITDPDSGCGDEVTTAAVEVGDELTIEATASATCDLELNYASTVGGNSGAASVDWEIRDSGGGLVSEIEGSPSGTLTLPAAGDYTLVATVSEERGDGLVCSASDSTLASVYDALSVELSLEGSCEETLEYSASVGGGTGGATVAWTFSDGSTSATASGSLSLGDQPTGGSEYTASVQVIDERYGGLICEASGSGNATVYSPPEVSISADAAGAECPAVDPGGSADAVTWTAAVVGGTGEFEWDWSYDACDGANTCTVDPPDGDLCFSLDLSLRVGDLGICDDATSETEHYDKTTLVEISGS